MELQDYWRAVRNHWVGAIVIVVATLLVAGVYTVTRPQVYGANASGLVGTGAAENGALGQLNDQLAKSRATSYVTVAKGRATAQAVIDALGLHTTPSALVGNIDVTQPADTILVTITARAGSPREAQRLADAWVAALADRVQAIESPNGPPPDGTPRIVPEEAAALPTSPVSPRPERNGALALVLGCLLALGYAVLRSNLDRRLRSADDVQKRLDVPVVAAIPAADVLRHEAGQRAPIAVQDTPGVGAAFAASEAFRKLRTNLMFMNVDNPPRSLVITSPRPSDGKSTVAANVAAAIASSGQQVILIDADLRRSTVADSFGVDGTVGLTNVLSGQVTADDVLQTPEGHTTLRVMTAGVTPPNPSELLGSQAMKALIETLGRDAIVILDAPPLLPVTDAALLSTSADGVLLVISAGRTLDTEVATCLDSLRAVNGRILGIVLNRVQTRHAPGGYYGYYGYSEKSGGASSRTKQRA